MPLVILSVCFVGFGQGALFPTLSLKALDQVSFTRVDHAIALTSSFTFLGRFLSPIVLDDFGNLVGTACMGLHFALMKGIAGERSITNIKLR